MPPPTPPGDVTTKWRAAAGNSHGRGVRSGGVACPEGSRGITPPGKR